MKRLFLIVLVVIVSLPAFQSCKKGENDPSISFKSRDARITAKWKLSKISSVETNQTATTLTTITITYDGSNYSRVTEVTGLPTDTENASGSYFMTIEKGGKMSWDETYSNGIITDVQSNTGLWSWSENDENKGTINIIAGNHYIKGGLWSIDRLATKELWLKKSGNSSNITSNSSWEGTWYFEKD